MKPKPVRNVAHALWLADHGWGIYGSNLCKFGGTRYLLSKRTWRALFRRGHASVCGGFTWNWHRRRKP